MARRPKTFLVEGMTVRAKRPARSALNTDEVQIGDVGTVEGIGPVWDGPTETYVGVRLDSGSRCVAHPVSFASNLWEPV